MEHSVQQCLRRVPDWMFLFIPSPPPPPKNKTILLTTHSPTITTYPAPFNQQYCTTTGPVQCGASCFLYSERASKQLFTVGVSLCESSAATTSSAFRLTEERLNQKESLGRRPPSWPPPSTRTHRVESVWPEDRTKTSSGFLMQRTLPLFFFYQDETVGLWDKNKWRKKETGDTNEEEAMDRIRLWIYSESPSLEDLWLNISKSKDLLLVLSSTTILVF